MSLWASEEGNRSESYRMLIHLRNIKMAAWTDTDIRRKQKNVSLFHHGTMVQIRHWALNSFPFLRVTWQQWQSLLYKLDANNTLVYTKDHLSLNFKANVNLKVTFLWLFKCSRKCLVCEWIISTMLCLAMTNSVHRLVLILVLSKELFKLVKLSFTID